MLFSMLEEAARRAASRVALATPATKLTYRQLGKSARDLARTLADAGVEPGTRVRIADDDPVHFAVGFFAVASLGAVNATGGCCSVDFTVPSAIALWRETRRGSRRREHGASVTGRSPRLADRSRLRRTGPVLAEPGHDTTPHAPRSQANLLQEAQSLMQAVKLTAADRVLCTLPVSHSPGLSVGLLASVAARASIVVTDESIALVEQLARIKPTVLITDQAVIADCAPPVLRRLGKLRLILTPLGDASPCSLEARTRLPGKLASFYHHVETGVIAVNVHSGAPDCAGRPLAGVRVILQRGGEASPVADRDTRSFGSFVRLHGFPRLLLDESLEVTEPGVSGRIVIENSAAWRTTAQGDRCYTDDCGYFDADGDLHLLPTNFTRQWAA